MERNATFFFVLGSQRSWASPAAMLFLFLHAHNTLQCVRKWARPAPEILLREAKDKMAVLPAEPHPSTAGGGGHDLALHMRASSWLKYHGADCRTQPAVSSCHALMLPVPPLHLSQQEMLPWSRERAGPEIKSLPWQESRLKKTSLSKTVASNSFSLGIFRYRLESN